jgi:hypothetical protein
MSIADHFEQIPDAGNVRTFDPQAARRQFSVSLVLVAVIAIAVSGMSILTRFDQPNASSLSTAAAPPSYAGTLTR